MSEKTLHTQKSALPTRKVTAATTGSVLGGAVAVLTISFFQRRGIQLSGEEAVAAVTLVEWIIGAGMPMLGAAIGGYFVRDWEQ